MSLKVTVTTRQGKGDSLTVVEADKNLTDLQHAVNASQQTWGYDETRSSGLTFAFLGGPAWNGSAYVLVNDGTVALTANALNYVQRSPAGAVTANTSGFTGGQLPMYEVQTNGTSIVTVTDLRTTYQPSGTGFVSRTIPSSLPALPMKLIGGSAPGNVVTSPGDAISAALAYNASISNSGAYYVKPSTGSDSNAGTIAAPFATVGQAMRTATGAASRVVMLEDAVIPSFDLRNSDASQSTQQFKWLDANGFRVTVRDSGPDLTTQTWAVDATYSNCYKSTLTVSGSQGVTRVLRTDQVDAYGYSKQLPNYTSAAALSAASGDGWYWDSTGKILWIKLGAGTNVQSQRSILKGLYTNSSGTSRILALGSSIGFSGVRFEGVQFVLLDGGSRRPEIWLHNCLQLWATGKGCDGTNAGWYVATNTTVYASQADCVNAYAPSATGSGLIFTVNCIFARSGDSSVFPLDGTLQGSSAHGGSNHVGWGNQYLEPNGQGVGDTCINSTYNTTWLVFCKVKGGAGPSTTPNYEFGSTATSAQRKAFLDTCTSESASSYDLTIAANGVVYTYNTVLGSVTGGSVTAYLPDGVLP